MRCSDFLGTVFPPSQNISVRATLGNNGSCAGIWFRAAGGPLDVGTDAYRVAVCPGRVTLISTTGSDGDIPLATESRTTTAGTPHLVQLVVDDQEVTVSIDGSPALTGPLTENKLVSGRVQLGVVAVAGGRATATFTDAQLRSGTDPAVPAVPAFTTGDAAFTADSDYLYQRGRVAIIEPTALLTGAEYCRRQKVAETSPLCAKPFVPVPSRVKVSLPINPDPKYFTFAGKPEKCVDPQTRVALCPATAAEFSKLSGGGSERHVYVTIRGGEIASVARMDLG